VCNAFLNSPSKEKIWSRAGPEIGEKEGCIIVLKSAIYGTKTAAKTFHDIFGDFLRRMGFLPTRSDQDLWYIKSGDYRGYDYITTHIDDFLIAAKDPPKYMSLIQKELLLRNIEDSPSYYLGIDSKMNNGMRQLSQGKYIKEVIEKFQEKMDQLKSRTFQSHQSHIHNLMTHHLWIWMELGIFRNSLVHYSGWSP